MIGWFFLLSVQMFQPLIVIYRRGNYVYHHWVCTSIYWPLSYPFRSLATICFSVLEQQTFYTVIVRGTLGCNHVILFVGSKTFFLIGCFQINCFQTFKPIIFMYRKGNFLKVYYHSDVNQFIAHCQIP